MKNLINIPATAYGIFAFGMAAGYAAAFLARKSKIWIPQLQQRAAGISMPRIIPVIPDLDQELISLNLEPHLEFDE